MENGHTLRDSVYCGHNNFHGLASHGRGVEQKRLFGKFENGTRLTPGIDSHTLGGDIGYRILKREMSMIKLTRRHHLNYSDHLDAQIALNRYAISIPGVG